MYKRVIIDLSCGSAVLRGADVFGPGVIAAPKGMMPVCYHSDIMLIIFSIRCR